MKLIIFISLVMFASKSHLNVIRNIENTDCNASANGSTNGTKNGTRGGCPAFSQKICPTKCDPSCKRPLVKRSMCRQPIICPKKECVCGPDYVKDNDHKCIPRERCSENCPIDEIFKLCPTSCEIHCGNVNNPPMNCPEDEREEHDCIAGCICPSGLIRDYSNGKCVPKERCSQLSSVSCPFNEEYRNCSSTCDRVCNKENSACDPSDKCKSGCFCKSGLIRQNINAKCIPRHLCKRNANLHP